MHTTLFALVAQLPVWVRRAVRGLGALLGRDRVDLHDQEPGEGAADGRQAVQV